MTRGGAIRRAKAMIRDLCRKIGHRWTGDRRRYCEACGAKEAR